MKWNYPKQLVKTSNLELTFRRATARDCREIYRVQSSAFGSNSWDLLSYLEDLSRLNTRLWIVAEADGKMVSFLGARYVKADNSFHGRNFGTLAGYQGQGIGRKLFGSMLDYLAEQGVKKFVFETKVTNPAKHLYERMGFVQETIKDHYYGDGTAARFYVMDLTKRCAKQ